MVEVTLDTVVCFFVIVVHLLEAEFLIVVKIVLKNILIVNELIKLLINVESCMVNLSDFLELLIYLVLLDHLLHMTLILFVLSLTNI